MSGSGNPFEQFLDDYGPCRSCPRVGCDACAERVVRFFREVLGIEPDKWQREELIPAYGRGDRGVSVAACHGPGKTLVAAGCAWHQLICRFPQHTVVTAPTKSQLYGAFMKEMRTIHGRLPAAIRDSFEVTNDKILHKILGVESLFEARTAREEKPEALQGVHCDLGWVLIIVDEASGVHEKIFEAGMGSMSGHRVTTMLLSNPTRTSGYFYETHNNPELRSKWTQIHVSASDSPRVDPEFVRDVAATYGADSNAYRVRVLGEFPKSDDDTIISVELVNGARDRDVVVPFGLTEIWGLDVARFGGDDSVLVRRNRLAVMPDIHVWHGLSLMELAGRVKRLYDAAPIPLRPEEIIIDEIGMGGGVLDRLRELGLPARGVNVGEASAAGEYRGLRTELWFKGKKWLEGKNRKLPKESCCGRAGSVESRCAHDQLAKELVTPRYTIMSDGRMFAEPKADMKKRGHKSPNVADAFLLTLASEPSTLMHGTAEASGWNVSWNKSIARDVAHV